MDNSDTAEYRTFQSYFDTLVTGVAHHVEGVARKAFTMRLILSQNLSSAMNRDQDIFHRATKLLQHVLDRIKQNPSCFNTVMTILKEFTSLEELSEELIMKLQSSITTQEPDSLHHSWRPRASVVTYDTITLEWDKQKLDCENINIMSYLVRYRLADDQTKLLKYKLTDSSDTELTITNLSPQTKYIFKVRPELEDGDVGTWSEESNPIETKPLPCQPGKPIATAVTHDSITLEWSKPKHNILNANDDQVGNEIKTVNIPIETPVTWQKRELKVIEMPCLGRLFCLGMLYNCQNDKLLDTQLCKDDVIQPLIEEISQVSHSCEVLEDDSLETKALSLQLPPSLKLSLMSNLIQDISKSAKYWNDRCKSKRQVRVSLKYTSTTIKKQLPTNNLTIHLQQQISEGATHVVTGVLYGFNAYCVFDHMLREYERFEDVHESMLTMVKLMQALSSSDSTHIESPDICTVYSDTGHSTLQEVVDQFHKFKDQSGKKKLTLVPIKVWLYPLEKLDRRFNFVTREVSISLADKVQSKLECLHHVQMLANDLLAQYSITFSRFQHMKSRVTKFTEIIKTYSNELQQSIAELLPEIRGEKVKEIKLAKVIEKITPFEYNSLKNWLKQVKEEISTLEMLMNQIKHNEIVTSEELQSILISEPDSVYNVCLMFHVALEEDQTISNLQSYLQSKQVSQCPCDNKLKWYTSTELMKKITDNIERFKTFMEINSENKRTKFVAVTCCTPTAVPSEPTSILLYEGTSCKPWEPPGPPGKPTVKEVTHDTVQLEWSQPEYGSQSVECYKLSYYPVNQPQDDHPLTTSSAGPIVTIGGLAPSTKYVFTVKSKCKLGLGAKGETSDPVETLQAPITQETRVEPVEEESSVTTYDVSSRKPKGSSITHNSITLEWTLPEESNDNVDRYLILYCKVDDLSEKWKKINTISSEQKKIVSDLSPQTKYIFKVRPELDDGEFGPWSEVSDPIETKAPICQPGKPTASAVTDDSIAIQWDKPSYHSEIVHSYIVCYSMDTQVKSGWKQFMTDSNDPNFTASNLSPQTKYIFKVRPKHDTGIGAWSEVSDPIKTRGYASKLIAGLTLGKPIAIEVSDKSITLQWKKPELFKDSIDHYTVTYRSVDDLKKQWKNITTDGAQENITLKDLINDTKYMIKVRSECDSGNGPSSELSDPIKTRATSQPGKPTASDVTHDSVMLKWSKPEYGSGKITSYKILYSSRSTNDHTIDKTSLTESNEHSLLIENLSANTVYTFQVQPICSENLGCTSAMSDTIKTKLTSSPGKPQAKRITHNSVTLTWTQPDYGKENIEHYIVKVVSEDTILEDNDLKTDGALETITVEHLDMKKKYRFKVCPECGEAGVGMESEMSDEIVTMATSPPGKPTVSKVTHESVSLEWTEPEEKCDNIDIDKYEVWSRETGKLKVEWKKVVHMVAIRTEEYKTTVGQEYTVDFDSEYEFKVVPICSSGNGSESEISEPVRTPTTPPGKPIESDLTHNSVKLKWTKSKHRGNIRYSIVCKQKEVDMEFEKNAILHMNSSRCSEDKASTSIGGLTPDTEYIFKVQSHCLSGPGAESEWSQPIRTECVYYKPGKPQVKSTKYNEVSIKWKRPDNGWEAVQYYTVHYQTVADQNWVIWLQNIHNTQCTVTGLLPRTSYIFKIESHLSSDKKSDNMQQYNETESENSEPIKTKATTPPDNVKADLYTSNNQHDVLVKWGAPKNGLENIKYYAIKYIERQPEGEVPTIDGSENTSLTTELRQLKGKTQYTITVLPICHDQFEGEPSESITIETPPSCKPGKADYIERTYNTITIKWPKPEHYSGAVKEYELSYYNSSTDKEKHTHRVAPKSHDGTEVTNLTHNTEYVFTVYPICEGSISTEPSCSDPIATMATSPPGKPLKSPGASSTHNSVTLRWIKPAVGSENIKYYEIVYRKQSKLPSQLIKTFQKSLDFKLFKTETNQEEATVGNLLAGTKYIFRVRAVCMSDKGNENRGVESDVSDPIETNAISPPGKPQAITCTHNSITLEWTKPEVGSIIVERYTLYYSRESEVVLNSMSLRVDQQKRESLPICTIPNLQPSTSYWFKVLPTGTRGSGSSSEHSELITTNSTGSPKKLKPGKVTHNSIHLQWESPEYGSEIIDHYQLSYRKLGNKNNWNKVDKIMKTDYCVQNLELNTRYVFKVLPICKDDRDRGTESEPSAIKTKATSPPGKPVATKVTHNSVHLKWTKPTFGFEPEKYIVTYYLKSLSKPHSIGQELKECVGESFEVKQLKLETKYHFVIRPVCGNCDGTESEVSDEITTNPVCKPGKPRAFHTDITYKSITLTWTKPEHGSDNIDYYIVRFKAQNLVANRSSRWREQQTQSDTNTITIIELNDTTQYLFQVCAKLKNTDLQLGIEYSDPVQIITKPPPLAVRLCRQAQTNKKLLLREGPPAVYQLPRVTRTMKDKEKRIAKCHFGDPELGRGKRERVLMLVGAIGEGKSTLIECMVNYILGVKWEDDFRFQIIKKKPKKSQAESQTRYITAYTFYPVPTSSLDNTLTIIDTPGYGDTRGINYDHALTEQIKEFISTPPPHGINHIDGVGFVVRAGSSRLTPTQQYIFDSILKVFGKDMEHNIFLMTTFCDGQIPEVLEAIVAAGIPNVGYFKLNNSALYANNIDTTDTISSSCWDMGFKTLGEFFTKFEDMESISLQLTRETLEERKQLENLVEELQTQITHSLDLIRELRQDEEAVITANQLGVDENNKPFIFKVEVMKGIEQDLPDKEKKVTVCLNCNYTCHYPCTIPDDGEKYKCKAMKGFYFQQSEESHCVKCPGRCHWTKHANKPYRYVKQQVEETRSLEDLIKKYSKPTSEQQPGTEDVLKGVAEQLQETYDKVLDLIKRSQESIDKLDQIALKKSDPTRETSSQIAYIEILIEAEKQGGKPGSEQQIEALKILKKRAEATVEVKKIIVQISNEN